VKVADASKTIKKTKTTKTTTKQQKANQQEKQNPPERRSDRMKPKGLPKKTQQDQSKAQAKMKEGKGAAAELGQ